MIVFDIFQPRNPKERSKITRKIKEEENVGFVRI